MNNTSTKADERWKSDSYNNSSASELSFLLSTAASEGRHEDVSRLIQEGSPFQPDGPFGMNPLHLAAMNGHLEVCRILLNLKVLVDTTNTVYKTALHLAAVNGDEEVVDLLLSAGASVDVCDMLQMTPLHWACDRGHTKVASLLLDHGADPDKFNKFQKSPRYIAVEKNHSSIVELMKVGSNDYQRGTYTETGEEVSELQPNISSDSSSRCDSGISSDNCDDPIIFTDESLPVVSYEEVICNTDDDEDESTEDLENLLNRSCDLNSDVDDYNAEDKLLKSLDELESYNFTDSDINNFETATTELLRAQAALVASDDPIGELKRAIRLGQTIKLTEAGKIAFSMIIPEPFVIPHEDKSKRKERENSITEQSRQNSECNTVALRNQTLSELYNELTEPCNFEVRSCRSPSSKRNRR